MPSPPAYPVEDIPAAMTRPAPGRTLLHGAFGLWSRIRQPMGVGVRLIVSDVADDVPRRRASVLLVKHGYTPGWHLPGGKVDRGEAAAEAALRELAEETGLQALPQMPPELLGVCFQDWRGMSNHILVYRLAGWSGSLRSASGVEIAAAGFFSMEKLPDALSPATKRRLEEWRARKTPDNKW